MIDDDDLIRALLPIEKAFSTLKIHFFVGGSVASSFRGAMRSTMDVDLVADIKLAHVKPLLNVLADQFYASETAINEAINRKASFNLIHLATSFKVDVFVNQQTPFDTLAFKRASLERIGSAKQSVVVRMASVEDIILAKLNWYRLGDEVSERQWDDISRLLKMHHASLDWNHLEEQARSLSVADLLSKLKSELGF